MPRFDELSGAQVETLRHYIRTQAHKALAPPSGATQ
jgi:hypothetical protein